MDGLIIGIDLCDAYTQINCYGEEKAWTIPTVICRRKNAEGWHIGEEAYGYALLGEGIIVDKLLKLVIKEGTSTINGTKYEGRELLKRYLKEVLQIPQKEYKQTHIQQIVVSVEKIDIRLMDVLMECADYLQIPREIFHIISHTEGFIYYVVSQKREVWNNQVGMFDLAEEGLHYYEMKVQRGLRQTNIIGEVESLEEGFNLNILENSSGIKLADRILCSCGERLLQKKSFSSVFLTGKGFVTQDWAADFMKLICNRRRVYVETSIFAKGAAYKAFDYLEEKTSYPYVILCEGRLNTSVATKVMHRNKEMQLVIAAAGENWYETKSIVEVIADHQEELDLIITPMDAQKRKLVKIPLTQFPQRPNRTTRLEICISFMDEKTMEVLIRDKGFGELFPATDAMIKQEVML